MDTVKDQGEDQKRIRLSSIKRRLPRRIHAVKLTPLGRHVRDFYDAREARKLDRELRQQRALNRDLADRSR